MSARGRAVVVVNRHAAAGRDASARLDAAGGALRSAGWIPEFHVTSAPGHGVELARCADTGSHDLLVAAGGDGTANEVASGRLRAGSDATPLAVLPLGTGNDFATLLGAGTVETFVEALRTPRFVRRDVLAVETPEDGLRAALLFAAVGFASDLLRATTPRVKRLFGPKLCYSVGFFRALMRHECPTLRVRIGDRVWDEPMVVALAGNSAHAGGGMMRVAPGARMDDGAMDVSLVKATGRLQVARQFVRLVRGTHVRHPLVRYFPAAEMEVEGMPPQSVAVDGEVLGRTPVRIAVRPAALRFLAGPHVD